MIVWSLIITITITGAVPSMPSSLIEDLLLWGSEIRIWG